MPASINLERAELRFRQRCCLAMSGPIMAPLVFRELHTLVPFANCMYMWLGRNGPVDAYFNVPEVGDLIHLYAERYFQEREAELWSTMNEAAARGAEFGPHHVFQVLRVPKASYLRHPIYNEIVRPSGAHTFIRFLVRDGRVPVGSFNIGRGLHDRDFNDAELRTMARLEPFISHALALRKEMPLSDFCDDSTAMVVADRSGQVRWLSPSAKALLPLMHGSALAPAVLHDGLQRTIRALVGIERGQADAGIPTWRASNAWGRFTARAYWLQPQESAESLVGILLERKVPREVRLMDSLRRLSLPARQEQVCRLLASGRSEEQIAHELGLTRNTVVYHRRQIYNRLMVDSRAQLVQSLIEPISEV